MIWYIYAFFGIILRRQVFDVNEGNDDWRELIHPEKYGLTQTQNFYIQFPSVGLSEDKIGAWFIRAKTEENIENEESCPTEGCPSKNVLEKVPKLGSDDTVIVLLHGNAKNRGATHRHVAYKKFQKQGFYTLTLDYRGYGDSILSSELNMTSVVQDAILALKFLRRELGEEFKLVVYGHSLGTGLGSKAVIEVSEEESVRVDGVILDSPFHSFEYAMQQAPNFYYYSSFFIDWKRFFEVAGLYVNTAQNVAQIKCPLTIFHAKNDKVCPIEGSKAILEDAKKSGKTNVKLVIFEEVGPEGNGHIGISKHEDFDKVVQEAVLAAHDFTKMK